MISIIAKGSTILAGICALAFIVCLCVGLSIENAILCYIAYGSLGGVVLFCSLGGVFGLVLGGFD